MLLEDEGVLVGGFDFRREKWLGSRMSSWLEGWGGSSKGRGWIPRKRIGVAAAPRKTREAREDGGWLWVIPMGIERVAARWDKKPRF